jgi:hypothetical protein
LGFKSLQQSADVRDEIRLADQEKIKKSCRVH